MPFSVNQSLVKNKNRKEIKKRKKKHKEERVKGESVNIFK